MSNIIEADNLQPPSNINHDMAEDFTRLVKSYPVTYFNMADADSIVNLLRIKKEINTINKVIDLLNIADDAGYKKYDKYMNTRNTLIKMQLKIETSLRISVNSRREVRANNKYDDDLNLPPKIGERDATTNQDIWA